MKPLQDDCWLICRFPDLPEGSPGIPAQHQGHTSCSQCAEELHYIGEAGSCIVCYNELGNRRSALKRAGVALRPAVRNAFGVDMLKAYQDAEENYNYAREQEDDERRQEGAERRIAAAIDVRRRREEAARALEEKEAAERATQAAETARKQEEEIARQAKEEARAALLLAQDAAQKQIAADKEAAENYRRIEEAAAAKQRLMDEAAKKHEEEMEEAAAAKQRLMDEAAERQKQMDELAKKREREMEKATQRARREIEKQMAEAAAEASRITSEAQARCNEQLRGSEQATSRRNKRRMTDDERIQFARKRADTARAKREKLEHYPQLLEEKATLQAQLQNVKIRVTEWLRNYVFDPDQVDIKLNEFGHVVTMAMEEVTADDDEEGEEDEAAEHNETLREDIDDEEGEEDEATVPRRQDIDSEDEPTQQQARLPVFVD